MSFKSGETDWSDPLPRQELRNLWAQGLSAAAIGRRMHLSKNAILGAAHRLKLPARTSPIIKLGEKRPPRRKPAPKQTLTVRHGEPEPPVLDIEKRKPGVGAITRTLPVAPPAPEPAPKAAWRHPDGCQWHIRREGIRHVFCCAPIGPRAGAYCAAHHALAYASAAASVPSHATDDARARL